ncbi:programmed cell death 1 ligand 1-like [Spea bombifrons]|uniref:programmed cell death 1 ligand 1-like n=1 Tax=Spea bombifrons TaxID=233779 RepID=UPI00234B047E|nr:programmed cell death 1 ligand 1-like [Spea bombifrons]
MDIHRSLMVTLLFWSQCDVLTGFSVTALFTVQATKTHYTAEYGTNIRMGCNFHVGDGVKVEDLTVYWEHSREKGGTYEVVKLLQGMDILSSQHKDFKGRVKILKDELPKGHAVIQINNVTLRDAGQYVCMVSYQGSDYKSLNLEVQAPYKKINVKVADIVTATGQRMKEIACQSVGYPEAEVTWLNARDNLSMVVNTSSVKTAEEMFNVTSIIRISSVANRTLTCSFWNKDIINTTSLTFTIPDDTVEIRSYRWMIITASCILILATTCGVLKVWHRYHIARKTTKAQQLHSNQWPYSTNTTSKLLYSTSAETSEVAEL